MAEESKLLDTAKRPAGKIHTEVQGLEPSSAAKSDAADARPVMYSESGAVSSAKSWGIRSPDRQRLAWSTAVLQKTPELIRGQVFLRNERPGQRELIYETQTTGGKITSTNPDLLVLASMTRGLSLLNRIFKPLHAETA